MPANQRKYAQAIPLAYICIFVAVLGCVATFGIKVLILKQELKQGAERLAKLRKDIAGVKTRNEALVTTRAQLTAPDDLRRAIKSNMIALKPIEDAFVVYVPATRPSVAVAAPPPAEEAR